MKKGFSGMRKPCAKCEEYFTPFTKHTKLCDKCHKKAIRGRKGLKNNVTK